MDVLTLSRLQFGSTVIYHYLFVPLSLGLSIAIALMETCYVRSNNPAYKRMAQFWGKLFFINFALGIVTGFVQELQFGMNWSVYANFMDEIIGAPSAIEALLAFFLESTFLGIWLLGWEQLSKKVHLAAIWLIVIITHISTFWILVVNSFMQEPVGFVVRNGHAEMTNVFALFTNPNLWFQFPHVFFASMATGAFFVVGISAYHLLKKSNERDLYQKSLQIGLILALIGSLGAALAGHLEGQYVVQNQPMKMAAAEALWHTENPASLSLFTIGDPNNFKDIFAIKIPYIESFLSYNSFNHPVQGISELQAQYVKEYGPGNYVPPVFVTYWAFRFMLGIAGAMAVLASAGLFLLWKKRLEKKRWFLKLLIAGIFIPYIGNTAGWVLTEIGRQPWLVFGQLKTDAGVSVGVSPTMILFTLITFIVLYGILAIVDAYLLSKTARRGVPAVEETKASEQQDDLASLICYVEPELRQYNVDAIQCCDAPGTELSAQWSYRLDHPAHHAKGAGIGFGAFPKVMLPSLNNASIHHRISRGWASESPASSRGLSLKKVNLLAYGQENGSSLSGLARPFTQQNSPKDVSPGIH